jgi:small GTP-binding protein
MKRGRGRASDAPTFKVCICGQQSVGKTAVLHRRLASSFLRDHRPTVAAAFATVMESVSDQTVLLNVWDTAGQEKYQNMMPLFFRGVACLVLVIDVTSRNSWEFVRRLTETELTIIDPRPLVFIVLNKIDLSETVDAPAIREWAEGAGWPFYRTSALTGEGVVELFRDMAAALLNAYSPTVKVRTKQIPEASPAPKCC